MTVFAVTGHMDLTKESEIIIYEAMKELLHSHASENLHGVSCIARGADTIFAEVILEIGGTLTVILPSQDYREKKSNQTTRLFLTGCWPLLPIYIL